MSSRWWRICRAYGSHDHSPPFSLIADAVIIELLFSHYLALEQVLSDLLCSHLCRHCVTVSFTVLHHHAQFAFVHSQLRHLVLYTKHGRPNNLNDKIC